MPCFELTFAVDRIPDQVCEALVDQFDAIVSTGHSGNGVVALGFDAPDCATAAHVALAALARHNVTVKRLQEDLVTRSDIAERLGVTRQAVGLWARGERQRGFPIPVNPVAGGVWLWGDVVRWAVLELGYDSLEASFPTQADHDSINAELGQSHPTPVAV